MVTNPQTSRQIRFFLLFIPAAYFSYLFHEFGHWSTGEMLGNDMVYTLNFVWPRSGQYGHGGDALYVLMGGPGFSILQALIGLLVIERLEARSAYPFVFFPMFNRFFSLVFGGFSKQDEAKISALLGGGTYTVALIVLSILLIVVARCSSKLDMNLKENGHYVVAATISQLLVIGTYELVLP